MLYERKTKHADAMRRRWADPEQRERLGRAISASLREKMANNPEFAEKRRAHSRLNGIRSAARLNTPAGSEQRKLAGARARATKLAWCPDEYRDEYRHMVKIGGLRAAEARRVMLLQMAADIRKYETGTSLPIGEFKKVRDAMKYLAERVGA